MNNRLFDNGKVMFTDNKDNKKPENSEISESASKKETKNDPRTSTSSIFKSTVKQKPDIPTEVFMNMLNSGDTGSAVGSGTITRPGSLRDIGLIHGKANNAFNTPLSRPPGLNLVGMN